MADGEPDIKGESRTHVISSDLRQAQLVKDQICGALKQYRFDEQALFAIKLALEEALANAVKHGNQGDANKKVTVRYAVTEERAEIAIRDEGEGFIPESIPDCTSPDRLPVPNGRGIMLMKAYMDEVCYRDQGREVYFVKLRQSAKNPEGDVPSSPVRRTIYFSGCVQGVGFRYTAETIAERYPITGFVRNLPDGRVELVAEGTQCDLDQFQNEIQQAMSTNIRDMQVSASPPTGQFKDFRIAS